MKEHIWGLIVATIAIFVIIFCITENKKSIIEIEDKFSMKQDSLIIQISKLKFQVESNKNKIEEFDTYFKTAE